MSNVVRKILIIDDENKLRSLLARIISLEGFEVLQAADGKSALRKLEQGGIDVIICDVKLPDSNGVAMTKSIKEKFPDVEVILWTAYGNIEDGVQAIKNGAFDYIMKGDDNNKIIPLLYRAFEKIDLARRIQQLEKQLDNRFSFDSIVGKSKVFLHAVEMAKKVAVTDTTVLITGETGTGKEVFAQAIHNASPRKNKNFVAVNCSAFSKELLESEMFGHKAGAFTGAKSDKKGLLEEAHNGTIFFDEIGEMSLELQAKLLRVLETGEFIKVGDTKTQKVNVRIIAATHRDLSKEIESDHFREDLFYRLSVFQIRLPSLRERNVDIEAFVKYFMEIFAAKTNKKVNSISPEFLAILKQHSFPGNIRELKNIVERSVILATSSELTLDTLPHELQVKAALMPAGKTLSAFELASAEKLHILKVLNYTNGNKTEAARLLNIAITTLYRKLDEYKIG